MRQQNWRSRFALGHVAVICLAMVMVRSGHAQQTSESDLASSEARIATPDSFKLRDTDHNGMLTEEEFVAAGGNEVSVLRRDFRVFDADKDSQLSVKEFLRIPAFTPDDQRTPIPDPVVNYSTNKRGQLTSHWAEWDVNQDGSLTADEFKTAKINQQVRGLEESGFKDWDLNQDGKLSQDEISLVLDIAFGVRAPTGELLRQTTGRVLDFRMFRNMKPDANWKVACEEYIKVLGSKETAEKWFPKINDSGDGRFGITEFSTTGHRTDPVHQFLTMDSDLNGSLSPKELDGLPPGWGPTGKNWLPGFDDDGDGAYSLIEFMLLPHVNLLTPWHVAQDLNQDGKLSPDEFRFAPMPLLAALSAEYFHRLDVDHDGLLSLKEWPFQTTHPDAKFGSLDTDGDDELSETEFVAEGSLPADRMRRDFKVFDADHSGGMNRVEFLSIPHWIPENQRSGIPDPIALLSATSLTELMKHWSEWDTNGDEYLSKDEFTKAAIGREVRGLEMTGFADWDRDHDEKISRADVALLLDIAFGLRTPTGDLLRSKSGYLFDWRTFQGLQPDRDGKALREAYVKAIGSAEKAAEWFPKINQLPDGRFTMTDFAASNHKIDAIGHFLVMDVDLDGQLSPKEMEALPAWGPPGRTWLTGFDDDGDGFYSLQEYRLLPTINLATTWQSARDTNNDGKLSPSEFRFMPTPSLSALSNEYFCRLDTNKDGYLQHAEWPCLVDLSRVPRDVVVAIRDRNGDGRLSLDEVFGDLRRPQPGEPANLGLEATLLRFEEAFLLADANDDGQLDLQELSTDEGLEVIVPGSSSLARKVEAQAVTPVSRFLGLEDATFETYAIIEINLLLVVAVAIYLMRKKGPAK